MISNIKISNRTECSVIEIEGVIGVPEKMQFRRPQQRIATYARFREALDEISMIEAAEVVVNIRSTGGDVNDALLIYDALKALKGRVTTHCYGYVASAATIIAQAASEGCRELSVNTLYLVHCSEAGVNGTARSMGQTQELLAKTDRRIAEIYAARSGREASDFEALMAENEGKGRWLSAQEAIAAGLADVIVGQGSGVGGQDEIAGQARNDIENGSVWGRIARFLRRRGVANSGDIAGLPVMTELAGIAGATELYGADLWLPVDGARAQRGFSAQLACSATVVREVEDPSPFEWTQSPNEAAYSSDIENIMVNG